MRIIHGDRWSGAALLAAAVWVGVDASPLRFGTLAAPGPGFFPRILAVALAVLALCVLYRSRQKFGAPAVMEFDAGIHRAALAFGAICAAALAMEALGFLVCAAAAMTALLRWISRWGWPRSLLAAVAAVAIVYGVFTTLGVPLPRGILPL